MLHLKDDMDVSSLTFLGTIAHIIAHDCPSETHPASKLAYAWLLTSVKLNSFFIYRSHSHAYIQIF